MSTWIQHLLGHRPRGSARPRDEKKLREAASVGLRPYLEHYGLQLPDFADRLRRVFLESQWHYARLTYQAAVATHHCQTLSTAAGRNELWTRIGAETGTARVIQKHWRDGVADPPAEPLFAYLAKLAVITRDFDLPAVTDAISAVQLGIARTLTFIRVFPPRNPHVGPYETDNTMQDLLACWRMLRAHTHYRSTKRTRLNQHALDLVYEHYSPPLAIPTEVLGELKKLDDVNEDGDIYPGTLYWPWLIFKFATTLKYTTDNFDGPNPYAWIWDVTNPLHRRIWGSR